MSWAVGWDSNWYRDIGYGVTAYCDHPECDDEIDRGLGYVCGGEPYGGEQGCGLYFCNRHLGYVELDDGELFGQICDRCIEGEPPFPPKPDHPEWLTHKLTHSSWRQWRDENPAQVDATRAELQAGTPPGVSGSYGTRSRNVRVDDPPAVVEGQPTAT